MTNLTGSKIKRRIRVIKAMIVSFFVMTVILICASIAIFKTIRTFVYGESLWTRSQITANYNLSLYAQTTDEHYYNNFLNHLKIIESDEAGLKEILDKGYVTESALDYIEAGNNDRGDLEISLRIFAYIMKFSLTQRMIQEWEVGNRLAKELKLIGEEIHSDYSAGKSYGPKDLEEVLRKIHLNNSQMAMHEMLFSKPLVDFARKTENLLGILHLSLFLIVSFLAIFIFYSTENIFKRSLVAIKSSIKDAVTGNLNNLIHIPPEEDIDGISGHLNLMYQSFKEQLKGRLSAQESEARLTILADAMPQIVCIYDKHHQVEFLNQVGKNFLGIYNEDIKNFSVINYCHPEEKARFIKAQEKGSSDKEPIEIEIRLKNTSNEYQWFLCRFQPIIDEDNEIIRWYGSFTNIQSQKVHSFELEKAVMIRDQFLSIASHELKTPLTALKLQTGMRQRIIDKRTFESIDLDYFQKIVKDDKKQIDRIIRLVDDMLDISRIKSGKLSFNYNEIEVNEFMIDVLQRFYPEFTERQCELKFDPIPMTFCYWDSHRIEQVMINLLSNALKYGRNQDVTVKLEKDSDFIRIHVTDQGEGIHPHNQAKIFELFERANHDQSVSGLGLGLFIVNQIIQSHQGNIKVVSDTDQGSTFIVSLPIRVKG